MVVDVVAMEQISTELASLRLRAPLQMEIIVLLGEEDQAEGAGRGLRAALLVAGQLSDFEFLSTKPARVGLAAYILMAGELIPGHGDLAVAACACVGAALFLVD